MSSQFTDSKDRAWSVEITIGKINRVRSLTGIHLGQPLPLVEQQADAEDQLPLLAQLSIDVLMFGSVLYAILQEQAERQKITQDDFLDGLTGQACQRAMDAFWKEYADFFRQMPHLPFAQLMGEAIDMAKDAVQQTAEAGKETLQQQKDEMRRMLQEAREVSSSATSGTTSTKPLEPSVLTRAG